MSLEWASILIFLAAAGGIVLGALSQRNSNDDAWAEAHYENAQLLHYIDALEADLNERKAKEASCS